MANETEKEKIEIRKFLMLVVATGMRIFDAVATDEAIFLAAESFVAKAEEKYGLPNPP